LQEAILQEAIARSWYCKKLIISFCLFAEENRVNGAAAPEYNADLKNPLNELR